MSLRNRLPIAVFALAVTACLAGSPPALAAGPASSPVVALEWQDLGAEQTLASREGKPILYFFTADWCAPCHHLKKAVFDDPVKGAQVAEWFVAVEVQDTMVETGENLPEVEEAFVRYGVSTIPTLVVALPDGTEVSQERGYRGHDAAFRWLERQAATAGDRIER